ncbi:hypothetical protein LMG29542_08605 [Paraburkholderia humisilvae]|uniref:Uncharacterized protein n=1 Tax=Paraburkholderia humisilvae TaxID=627669 RepID=A0A6J5FA17_9BURK|nr:hypothetical protein LMG29542_08605 [Paraburkholderia humisilvae]
MCAIKNLTERALPGLSPDYILQDSSTQRHVPDSINTLRILLGLRLMQHGTRFLYGRLPTIYVTW